MEQFYQNNWLKRNTYAQKPSKKAQAVAGYLFDALNHHVVTPSFSVELNRSTFGGTIILDTNIPSFVNDPNDKSTITTEPSDHNKAHLRIFIMTPPRTSQPSYDNQSLRRDHKLLTIQRNRKPSPLDASPSSGSLVDVSVIGANTSHCKTVSIHANKCAAQEIIQWIKTVTNEAVFKRRSEAKLPLNGKPTNDQPLP